MYSFRVCEIEGCERYAVSNQLRCLDHLENREIYIENTLETFKKDSFIRNFNLETLSLESFLLKDKSIIVSNFSGGTFINVDFTGSSILFLYFNFLLLKTASLGKQL